MLRLLPGAALLLTLGCSRVNLADTPVVGGTEPVRQAIQTELAAFGEATGRAHLPVSRVRVADLGQTHGRYNHVTDSITLDDELDALRVIEVLRHELCHALDDAEQLHQQQPHLYERLAHGIFSSSYTEEVDGCEGPGCQQREVFAAYCARGPWIAHATAQRCSSDPLDGQRLLQSMAEQIWRDSDEPLSTSEGPRWATVELAAGTQARARGTTQPETLALVLEEPEVTYLEFLDAGTGAPSARTEIQGEELAPVGSPEGPYVGTFRLPLFGLGEVERRVWYDGERWWLAGQGCTEEPEPFLVGEDVLTLRTEGQQLSWGPLVP
jgi:hypothetical protein